MRFESVMTRQGRRTYGTYSKHPDASLYQFFFHIGKYIYFMM